jgi:thiol-disulfide isomerase/thioredoxin
MKTGLVVTLIAVAAAAAGFAAYRAMVMAPAGGTPAATASSKPVPAASATAVATPDAPARVVPESVPEVSLADLAGKQHPLREFRGRPTIYNFWATWCLPCRREIPLLNQLSREFARQKLQIVGIAVDFKDDVAKFLQTTKLDYSLLVGEEDGLEAAEKFGMEMALPFTIFSDSQQRIVAVKVGELHRDDADAIINALLAVDAGTLPLVEARTQISSRLRELAQTRTSK